jgi:hypothetical protein
VKCVNCDNHAVYTVADAGVNPVDYCLQCLPKHLRGRADAGQLQLAFSEDQTPKKSSKKKEEPAAEEPAAEETPAEETAETPTE